MLETSKSQLSRDDNDLTEDISADELQTSTKKASNNDSGLKWPEETIYKMIHLWRERPLLYNTKHPEYSNKVSRRMAMVEIAEELTISVQEILSKMVSLRTYYGSQHRKKIAWEKKGFTSYKSRWHFFDELEFLQDYMTQKQVESNITSSNEDSSDCQQPCTDNKVTATQHIQDHTSILARPKRKLVGTNEPLDGQSSGKHSDAPLYYNLEAKKTKSNEDYHSKSDDELFADMLMKSLSKIEEGEGKEALKIEIQNLVFKTRFGRAQNIQASPSMATREQRFDNGYRLESPVRLITNDFGAPQGDRYEEASLHKRRKATHPQRSVRSKKSPEDYSMVSLSRNDYSEQEPVDIPQ